MLRIAIYLVATITVSLSYAHPPSLLANDWNDSNDLKAKKFIAAAIQLGGLKRSPKLNIENGCEMQRFHIDFRDLGWNFVLAPQRLDIGICAGDCDNEKPSTLHEHILKASGVTLQKNCAADGYVDSKVVYMDGFNKIHVVNMPQMVALSCHCV